MLSFLIILLFVTLVFSKISEEDVLIQILSFRIILCDVLVCLEENDHL